MTATPSQTTGWSPIGNQTQLPPGGDNDPQASTTQAGAGQALYFDAPGLTGKVAMNDGTVASLLCAGVGVDRLSAPGASIRTWKGLGTGQAGATGVGDAIGVGDQLIPVFDAGTGVPGKLSNSGGNDRSFMGLAFGLNDLGYPIIWAGPEASALARAIHSMNGETAVFALPADGAANTATAEIVIGRGVKRVTVTGVDLIASAGVIASDTNYASIAIARRRGAVSVPILTATTQTTAQSAGIGTAVAWTPTALATINNALANMVLRENDVLTIAVSKFGTGVALPASSIRVNMKVI